MNSGAANGARVAAENMQQLSIVGTPNTQRSVRRAADNVFAVVGELQSPHTAGVSSKSQSTLEQ